MSVTANRKLWTATALLCLTIVAAGVPACRDAIAGALAFLNRAHGVLGFDWSVWALAMGITSILLGGSLRAIRLANDPAHQVRRRARRGDRIPAIARRLALSQDAVRDLLGDQPLPVAAERRGSLCRQRPEASAEPPASFREALRRSGCQVRG